MGRKMGRKAGAGSQFLAHDASGAEVHSDSSHSNLAQLPLDGSSAHTHDIPKHAHVHGDVIREKSGRVLFWCLIATFFFAIIEGMAGYLIHSIALQSDAVHMLTDAAGLLIAYYANVIARKPATVNLSFGYGKAEVLGALINAMFTTMLTLWLLFEVIGRLFSPVTVLGGSLFIVASLGFLVNGVLVWFLSHNAHSLNTKAAMIHALGDLLASAVAIVAGAIIYFTGWSQIDPLLSLIVIVLLMVSNFKLIKKSSIILMAGVPEHLDYEEVGKELLEILGVQGVHDLHIWYISANQVALAAHIVVCKPTDWPQILQSCQSMLLEKFKIDHVTLQYEFDYFKCSEFGNCGGH